MILHFGEENVFQDVDNIPIGANFRRYLQDEIAKCDVILVVIGPDWGRIMQERAQQNNDFVRIEVESALKLGKFVVPVTVKEAKMPDMSQLPSSIQELGELNAATLRFNPHFKQDCQRLAEAVKQEVVRRQEPFTPQLLQGARGSETPPPAPKPTPPSAKPDPVQEALTRARSFIHEGKKNADWTPFITRFPDLKIPDMPFCLVPTGTFQMGNDQEAYDGLSKGVLDGGKHIFDQPFYIAQYSVTNAQWRLAVKAGVVGEPETVNALNWYNDPLMMNAPVLGVSWFECQRFAQWVGCRLPTEREWEYAARSVESLVYPWGNEFVADNVVYDKNSGGKPWDVTSKPEGVSWVGAHHLSGNVWEWQASLYDSYPYIADGSRERDSDNARRVLRGGSWNDGQGDARAAYRVSDHPLNRGVDLGFRVVLVFPSSLGH
ncbi:MAG: SUMF1/EgtB/PvdO family nonheme iron enzyme [Anaerolineae bacterium]|nr:SUMF1/EgtB/PvdO family nonheme iron enzyme [Anaerolineae bacterium]